jgi:hypothetical protein
MKVRLPMSAWREVSSAPGRTTPTESPFLGRSAAPVVQNPSQDPPDSIFRRHTYRLVKSSPSNSCSNSPQDHISQTKFSRRIWFYEHRCGLERSYFGGVERGERNLTFLSLRRSAPVLTVTLQLSLKEFLTRKPLGSSRNATLLSSNLGSTFGLH